jgi:cbb3-type cytochrome oxidase subunit 3
MLETLINLAPTISTIFFFSVFCMIIFLVFKKGAKKKFDDYSQIPFNDEQSNSKNLSNKNKLK